MKNRDEKTEKDETLMMLPEVEGKGRVASPQVRMGDISRSSSQLIWNELIWDVSEHIPKEAVYDIGVRLETQH